jgi:hypothetical protein
MNTSTLIYFLFSLPIFFQFLIGNRALDKTIKLPYWTVCLFSFLLLLIVTASTMYITWTAEFLGLLVYVSPILIGIILIQSYVHFTNEE